MERRAAPRRTRRHEGDAPGGRLAVALRRARDDRGPAAAGIVRTRVGAQRAEGMKRVQRKGIRKRLRCRSVFVNTYVDGSCPGEMLSRSMMRAPGMEPGGAARSMPPGGRSGNDFPGGTGIASVLPGVSAV